MKLAVFFPGIGYHCDKPLLYYARRLALQHGFEQQICLRYVDPVKGDKKNLMGNAEKLRETAEAFYIQTENQLADIDWSQYEEVLFVSKSVGTVLAAEYALQHKVQCRNIFYTPLEQTFLYEPGNGIAFTGTKDPWVDSAAIIRGSREYGIPLYVIPDANHSLETSDVHKNLENMIRIMEDSAKMFA